MNEKKPIPDVLTSGLDFDELLDELAGLTDGSPMAAVAYTFVNKNDLMESWQVRDMLLVEELSRPYQVWLTLVSEDHTIDVKAMLGAECELVIDRQDVSRTIRGLARTVESLGSDADHLTVRVELVPAFALLDERVDTRLWQDRSVLDVVSEVLQAGLADYCRQFEIGHLQTSYPCRQYIVQYHESDFDFVNRLLEEEGIFYTFDQDAGDSEVLTLEDSTNHSTDVMSINDSPVLHVIADHGDIAEVESIQQFVLARELTSTTVYQRIFDWLEPTSPIEASVSGVDARGWVREVYHHGRFVEADPGARTIRKLQHRRRRELLASGQSNVTNFQPGQRFAIFDPGRPEIMRTYILRRVLHTGDCPEVDLQGDGDQPRYQNTFECQIFDPGAPPRPLPITPRPKIRGPQTAIVTGPKGEEIHTDEHGRIKVRFDWDRAHSLTDDTSMWIRVAHNWAGPGFGTFFVPRIGMEVVVDFLEGDPDKPLVVGCVYNGANDISVGVPGNKTQSTIRTRSSPSSEGYNELRFEDATGCEEVFIHAQHDLNEVVLHCHSTTVNVDQTDTVGVNQTISVGANQSTSVGGNQSNTVSGNQTESISGDQCMTVSKTRTKTITQDETNTLEANRTTTVMCDEDLSVTGTTTITSQGNYSLTCQAETSAWSKTKLLLNQNDVATLEMTGGAMTINTNSTYGMTSKEAASITSSDAGVVITGCSEVKLTQGAATVLLSGGNAEITASSITLKAGGDTVELTDGAVNVTSSGPVSVSGSVVKLNC